MHKKSYEIIADLLNKYTSNEKINTSFEKYTLSKCHYNKKIYKEVIGLIPNNLYIDPLNEYAFLNEKDFYKRYEKSKEKKFFWFLFFI